MNKLFVSLPLVLLAFVLPASASAGQAPPPGLPAENQIHCGPDAECEPPTEICLVSTDEENPLPAQENCIWPDDPCLSEGQGCPPIDDSCMLPGDELPAECVWPDDPCLDDPTGCHWPPDPCVTNWTEDGSAPGKCDWPHDPCDLPRPWTGGAPKGDPETDEADPPKPGECEDFPHEYCYVEGSPGDEGESDPGSGESGWVEPLPGYWSEDEGPGRDEPGDEQGEGKDQGDGDGQDESVDDPDFTVCIYDLAPPTSEKGKTRAEIRKERAQARRKAARQRAQARRKAARKRAAIKRQKMKAKAKKAAKSRNG